MLLPDRDEIEVEINLLVSIPKIEPGRTIGHRFPVVRRLTATGLVAIALNIPVSLRIVFA